MFLDVTALGKALGKQHLPTTQALRSAGESGVTAITLKTPARWEARQPANANPHNLLMIQTLT